MLITIENWAMTMSCSPTSKKKSFAITDTAFQLSEPEKAQDKHTGTSRLHMQICKMAKITTAFDTCGTIPAGPG